MKDRLLKILNHLGYTATHFADELGVQRSGISHILSGRNQPSYDFIAKIMTKFPELDPEWLILGKGNMIKEKKATSNPPNKTGLNPVQQDLFSPISEAIKSNNTVIKPISKVTNVTLVNKVILLHTDGTFEEYKPASKD
jgi:transcriptional regulator with XRE-family HTH domain